MLIKILREGYSQLPRLIRNASAELGIEPLSFDKWITLAAASYFTGIPPAYLLTELLISESLHGIELKDKRVFVHPDELIKLAKKNGKKFARKEAKKIYTRYLKGQSQKKKKLPEET